MKKFILFVLALCLCFMTFGAASAESWIYFGVALLFIGISTFIITRAVKSYE